MAITFTNNGGAGDGTWNTATNWPSNTKPIATDDVIIAADINQNDDTATCKTLTVNTGKTFSGSSPLAIASSASNTNININTGATVTYSGNITLTLTGNGSTHLLYFGGKTFSGTTTLDIGEGTTAVLLDSVKDTFGNLTVVANHTTNYPALGIFGDIDVTGTLTLTGNVPATKSNIRLKIYSYANVANGGVGLQRTITAKTFSVTGSMDFIGIKLIDSDLGDGTPIDLSAIASGDCGGNSNITFRTPATYYLKCGTANKQDYEDVYSTSETGTTPDGLTVFPLPQDTLIINNYTWIDADTAAAHTFYFHAGGRTGTVDASALTDTNKTLGFPTTSYGDLILTGSGVLIPASGYTGTTFDGRLKNETGSDTLDINVTPSAGNGVLTITSQGGTVRLIGNLTHTGTLTLTKGTLDLNGFSFTTTSLASTGTLTRTLQATGGGTLVLNSLGAATLWDLDSATASTLTLGAGALAPNIQIGDGDNTLAGNLTFEGGGLTYGNFTVKKHAGNFPVIIQGSNTFGTVTLETPDDTYSYSDIKFTAGTTTTVSSFVADGTAGHKINIGSVTEAQHTLTDPSGTNTVSNCNISYSNAIGGAQWKATSSTNGGNNGGWVFLGWVLFDDRGAAMEPHGGMSGGIR